MPLCRAVLIKHDVYSHIKYAWSLTVEEKQQTKLKTTFLALNSIYA